MSETGPVPERRVTATWRARRPQAAVETDVDVAAADFAAWATVVPPARSASVSLRRFGACTVTCTVPSSGVLRLHCRVAVP